MPAPADDLWSLKFDAGKSLRYHSHLRSGWSRVDHWNKVGTAFLGAGVVVSVIGENHIAELSTAIATAFFSSLDLVLKFSEKKRLHAGFYKKWSKYLEKLEEWDEGKVGELDIKKLRQERFRIERGEPDVFQMMERKAYAEECAALGCENRHPRPLGRVGRLICYIVG